MSKYKTQGKISCFSPFNNPSTKEFDFGKYEKNLNKYIITYKKVVDTFKLFAIEQNYLTKKAFNDALEHLFVHIPIEILHHTHLSDKLYNIFNISGNLKLNQEEFINCIKQIFSDKNKRLHLSMMAMMRIPNKVKKILYLDELKEFFYESFVEGYKHMAYKINQKPEEFKLYGFPVISISQIEAWAREFERKIKIGFEKDLKRFDSNIKDSISFEQFSKWLDNDQTLYIKYGFKTFKIATSLINFDDVEFQS